MRHQAGVQNLHAISGHQRDPGSFGVAEAKLNSNLCFVYNCPAVCTVQQINTWRHAGLSRGFIDYFENKEHKYRNTDTQGFLQSPSLISNCFPPHLSSLISHNTYNKNAKYNAIEHVDTACKVNRFMFAINFNKFALMPMGVYHHKFII